MAAVISEVHDPLWLPTEAMDPDRFVVTYDRLSDTMYVHFFDRSPPAVSFPLNTGESDYLYLRGDVETGQVVGFQIEDFLSYAVDRHPGLVDLLDMAELRGITPAEVAEVRRGPMAGGRRSRRCCAWRTRTSRRRRGQCRSRQESDGRSGRRAAVRSSLAGARRTVPADRP